MGDGVPTRTEPKSTDGVMLTFGVKPSPASATVVGPFGSSLLITRLPVTGPEKLGTNAIETCVESPGCKVNGNAGPSVTTNDGSIDIDVIVSGASAKFVIVVGTGAVVVLTETGAEIDRSRGSRRGPCR